MNLGNADNIYFGSTPIDKVYLGSALIWDTQGQQPVTDPLNAFYRPNGTEYYVNSADITYTRRFLYKNSSGDLYTNSDNDYYKQP